MHDSEKAYTTKEISLTLGIGSSTLRKWCMSLEENGYQFIRNDKNSRSFIESDIVALKYFQKLVKGENFTLDNASKIVTSKHKGVAFSNESPAVLQENNEEEQRSTGRSEELLLELLEKVEAQKERADMQEQFNKELLERLDRQQKYIDERLNAQEERLIKRDEALMQSLRNSMEQQALLAASQEEQKKKSFWSRLFGR